jgi:hypothetical protein
LQQEYFIFSGEEKIGAVVVQQQGLYYRISCRCNLTGSVRYKLLASCGNLSADLGLCIPKDNQFGVDTAIPVKRLGHGELSFRLVPKHSRVEGDFVTVSADEPFGYIQQLQKAHLVHREGVVGIALCGDQSSMDNPTGQWSEPITSE